MTYKEFESSLKEILDNNSSITVGNDMSVNTRITVREDGQVFISEYESYRRVETNININDIVERRKEVFGERYYFIDLNNRALAVSIDEDEVFYCVEGKPSGYGSAFEHFITFPVDENHTDTSYVLAHDALWSKLRD